MAAEAKEKDGTFRVKVSSEITEISEVGQPWRRSGPPATAAAF
jgi:hypothetical protein